MAVCTQLVSLRALSIEYTNYCPFTWRGALKYNRATSWKYGSMDPFDLHWQCARERRPYGRGLDHRSVCAMWCGVTKGALLCPWQYCQTIRRSSQTQISHNLVWLTSCYLSKRFEILHRARQCHCRALCKVSKRVVDKWYERYGRTRFHEIWIDFLYCESSLGPILPHCADMRRASPERMLSR